jgi:hypothetical protein
MSWKTEDLLNKAVVYFQRAFALDRENELFPLWSSLGLELLARAALAKVHPALLADPTDGGNLLYVFGFPNEKPPKSIPATTLFKRLIVVVPAFKQDEFSFCTGLMTLRNAELHSGELSFENYPVGKWLPDFFRICKILSEFCGKELKDILGDEEAQSAEEMIAASQAKLHDQVNELIKIAKLSFEALPPDERLEKIKAAGQVILPHIDWKAHFRKCPACGANGVLKGEIVKFLESKVTEDSIEERAIIMPTSFTCVCCGLKFPTHHHVFIAGMGDQYTESNYTDPKDYYGIKFDPRDYVDDEYGND